MHTHTHTYICIYLDVYIEANLNIENVKQSHEFLNSFIYSLVLWNLKTSFYLYAFSVTEHYILSFQTILAVNYIYIYTYIYK